jgi:hypothetical protein
VKRFQDQAVDAEKRTSGSGEQKNGAEKIFQDQGVNAERTSGQGDIKIEQRKIVGSGGCCGKKTPGSGGKKNGAEKKFQDQAVDVERRTPG